MKKISIIAFILVLITSCATKNMTELTAIEKYQKELVDFYSDSKTTPLNAEEKAIFKGITFFPVDEIYKVKADFIPINDGDVIPFPTSAGKIKHYKEYALINFKLEGKEQTLTIYQSNPIQEQYADHLFLPFTDETNGETTYGGGRYIDLSINDMLTDDGKVVIDFNQAYNPYCAYSKRYNCPIPPGNNSLNVEVKAGVTYKK